MPTITGDNALEWKMKEMARRAGKKYEPETKNPFQGMTKEELKQARLRWLWQKNSAKRRNIDFKFRIRYFSFKNNAPRYIGYRNTVSNHVISHTNRNAVAGRIGE